MLQGSTLLLTLCIARVACLQIKAWLRTVEMASNGAGLPRRLLSLAEEMEASNDTLAAATMYQRAMVAHGAPIAVQA